jgi:ribosomal protein S18 acetylase RimI-like enzyme
MKDGTRVGYLAARSETFNGQPVRWISSVFILPAYQRQGLAPQFMALASQRYFQKGNVGCRVATTNVRVIRLLMNNGFRKVRQTTQWVDLFFELPQTFVPGR